MEKYRRRAWRAVAYAVLLAVMTACAGCSAEANANTNTQKLAAHVAKMNDECPSWATEGFLLSVKYDEAKNEVTLACALDDGYISAVYLRQRKENMAKLLQDFFVPLISSEDYPDDKRQLFQYVVDAGASVKAVYKELWDREPAQYTFSAAEVAAMAGHKVPLEEINRMCLESYIYTYNSSGLSYHHGSEMCMRAELEDGYLVIYMYTHYDLKTYKELEGEWKQEILNNPVSMKRVCVWNYTGIKYRFYTDDPKKAHYDIAVDSDELEDSMFGMI